MDPKIVGKALKGAQRLMNDPGFNNAVANKAMSVTEDSYVGDGGYITEDQVMRQGGTVQSGRRYKQGVDPMDYSQMDLSEINSNLPKNILQAMMDNPIDMAAATPGFSSSVLDTLENYEQLERPKPVQRQRRQINEQSSAPAQAQYGGSIDYNYIKYLVSEAMKETLQETKQSLITEGALAGIKIANGGKIVLVDTKGNVFEAKLVKKAKE